VAGKPLETAEVGEDTRRIVETEWAHAGGASVA
jgi:hypothetical protein